MIKTFIRSCFVLILSFSLWPELAAAQGFPSRPLKIVVGFAPGGSSDITARAIADLLQKKLGQPVILENRPGAGGLTAAEQVRKSPADGYTLLLVTSAHAVTGAMRRQMSFDPVNDFTWLSTLVTYGMVYGVRADSPYKSLGEFIAAAKAAPKSLSYYSVGTGTAHHLLGEWLNAAAGIELVHVPYRGSAAALADFIAGRVDLMIDTMTFASPQTESGNVRPLAVTSQDRRGVMANVPFSGSTVDGLAYESWLGLVGPKDLPADVAQLLTSAIREAASSPEFAAKMSPLGATAKDSSPADFKSRVESDIERFKIVVKARAIGTE